MLSALGLVVWAIFGLGCGDGKKEPESAEVEESQPELVEEKGPAWRLGEGETPRKPWNGLPKLVIYYDREPLAGHWLSGWAGAGQFRVEQKKLEPGPEGSLPADGDLYVVSPPRIKLLRSLRAWKNPEGLMAWDQVNPLFTGHSFDLRNEISVPWRWSPYVFFQRKSEAGTEEKVFSYEGWEPGERTLWPRDWPLLWAMKRHVLRGSANAPVGAGEIEVIRSLKKRGEGEHGVGGGVLAGFGGGKN
ncbi:MAG: hypothetical protein HC904_14930 [Blastochloris sp.]|nr:hypothetical protein [Blastochloris sp.]